MGNMIIKEGTKLTIVHARKGKMNVIAFEEFDTEAKVFWPVILDEREEVIGQSGYGPIRVGWREGDKIPCRGALVKEYEVTGHIDESSENAL